MTEKTCHLMWSFKLDLCNQIQWNLQVIQILKVNILGLVHLFFKRRDLMQYRSHQKIYIKKFYMEFGKPGK